MSVTQLGDLEHLLIRALLLQLPGLLDGVNLIIKQPEPALLLASALVRDGQDVLLMLDRVVWHAQSAPAIVGGLKREVSR